MQISFNQFMRRAVGVSKIFVNREPLPHPFLEFSAIFPPGATRLVTRTSTTKVVVEEVDPAGKVKRKDPWYTSKEAGDIELLHLRKTLRGPIVVIGEALDDGH